MYIMNEIMARVNISKYTIANSYVQLQNCKLNQNSNKTIFDTVF